MALTLANLNDASMTAFELGIVENIRRTSYLFDAMTFDPAAVATGGGSLVYGYTRELTMSGAAFRDVNDEYTASNGTNEPVTVAIKRFGGTYPVDRAARDSNGLYDIIADQANKKLKAAINLFHSAFVNGTDADAKSFDGIEQMIDAGQVISGTSVNLTTASLFEENKHLLFAKIDEALQKVPGANLILVNDRGSLIFGEAGRRIGYITAAESAMGIKYNTYNGVPIVSIGKDAAGAEIIRVNDGGATPVSLIDVYVLRLGTDGIMCATRATRPVVENILPNFDMLTTSVCNGLIEIVATPIFKTDDCVAKVEGILTA
jgi:hypothetical protein